ncbi:MULTISPECIES: hypothetical protein [unclassified Acinetobacter]|uniref:hypothetical protein n=1 Tax=unclassified Acinetobacter TaxID=196816 RepID=UPI00124C2DC8|nr:MULTISPECIES: hypothetical protein [unclassified Acinetobacter]
MEQKLSHDNNTFNFKSVSFVTVIIAFIVFTGISIAVSKPIEITDQYKHAPIPDLQASTYGVAQLSITSKNTGTGLINLDGFLVPVDFKFDAYPSDYGVHGTEYVAVEITQLDIGQILNKNGKQSDDFTNFQDHKNINEALKNFIEVNKLVEAS